MFEKTKALLDSFLELNIPGFDILVYKAGYPVTPLRARIYDTVLEDLGIQ